MSEDDAREAWLLMSDFVLDHQRRRRVADAVGVTFGRVRALRRLARRSMSMRELADALEIDPPNATVLVDDLEKQGFVRRRPHPTDRRAKLVEVTDEGARLAAEADTILATPPPALAALSPADASTLLAILRSLRQ